MFPQTQSFSLSSQHSSAFSLRSSCFSLSHLLWSSFYDPIFLYWYYQCPLSVCTLPFPDLMTAALPCAVLGTTHISDPSLLAALRISSVLLETPRMCFQVVTPTSPLSFSADISRHTVLSSSLHVNPSSPSKPSACSHSGQFLPGPCTHHKASPQRFRPFSMTC